MTSTPDHPAHPHGLDEGWFYHRGGVEHGPLSRESLAEALRLIPSIGVLVWHASLPDWASPAEPQVRTLIHGAPPAPERPRGLLALLFSFDGRIGRARYFWTYCLGIAPYIVGLMAALLYARVPIDSETGVLIRLALAPPFVWIGLALTAKRLHDFDMSATHLVWVAPAIVAGSVVPPSALGNALLVVNGAVELWLLLKRGTTGPNRYGRGPSAISATTVVVPLGKREASWNVWTGLLAFGLIAIFVYVLGASRLPLSGLLRPVDCSRRDISDKVISIITGDPKLGLPMEMLGGASNLRMTLIDIRTLSYDEPLHGVTCAATVHTETINPSHTVFGTKISDSITTYTVQGTDADDGRYVVTVLSD